MTTKEVNRASLDKALSTLSCGYFINGNTGVGKTFLVKKHLGESPRSINRINDACDEKGNYSPDSLWKKEQVLIMSQPRYVIDDLGNEDDRYTKILSRIIEDRHTAYHKTDGKWKTIITTNLTLEELARRYGAGTLRRIAEMCVCFTLIDTCMTKDKDVYIP